MTRGFRNKEGKAVDARIAGLRPGYLSAIAWREAEWLCGLHIAIDDRREWCVRGKMSPRYAHHVIELRTADALENRRAREELLEWCSAAARRAWTGKYGFMGHALPRSERDPDFKRASAATNAAI